MGEKLRNFCFFTVALFVTSLSLQLTKSIMIPFILSVFLSFILQPLLQKMRDKLKLGQGLSVLILCVVFAIGFILVFLTIGSSVKQLINNANNYEQRFTTLLTVSSDLMSQWDEDFDPEQLKSMVKELPIFSALKTITNAVVKGISDFSLIAIFTLFILSGPQITIPSGGFWGQVSRSIRTYLLTKFVSSAVTGLATAIILKLVDLDMALMFGLMAFVLNFIPTFGSIFATLLPIPVILLQFSNPVIIGISIGIPAILQFVVGNVIEPKIMGDSLDLHPVTLLICLMFWGFLWGVPGMLLATPFTVIIKIFLASHESTKPLAEAMAGRLTLQES